MQAKFVITAILAFCLMHPASARRLEAGTSTALWGKAYAAEELNEARSAGINYIEVAVNQSYRGVPQDEVIPRMRACAEIIAGSGVKVWSVHLPFSRKLDISVVNDSLRAENVRFLSEMICLCKELYSPERFVLHPSSEPISPEEREHRIACAIASIRELKAAADDAGVPLCIENLPRTCLGNTPEELVRIVDAVPGVYICFDTNHYVKGTTGHFIEVAGNRIKTVHISDFDYENECHWLPYDGNIKWGDFLLDIVSKAGYDGVFMYEVKKRADGSKATVKDVAGSFGKMSEEYKKLK